MQVTDDMVDAALEAYHSTDGAPFARPDACMRAALTAALAAMWRPIEDAPKDGEWLLATDGTEVFKTQGSYGNVWIPNGKGGYMPDPVQKTFNWLASEFVSLTPWSPTHFMPLPQLPKVEG